MRATGAMWELLLASLPRSPGRRQGPRGKLPPAGRGVGMNPVNSGGTAAEAGVAEEAAVLLVGPRRGHRRGGSPCRRAALRCGRVRVPGDALPRPAPASQGERGPYGPAAPVPLLPGPFAHSCDSAPALRGSGCERGTDGSPTALWHPGPAPPPPRARPLPPQGNSLCRDRAAR